MNEKRHYATVAPAGEPYIARVGDATIARSERAMLLEEVKDGTHYPVVVYFPRADAAAGALLPSDRHSRCPIKGEAGYFSVKAGSEKLENVAWTYPDQQPAAAPAQDTDAFSPDKLGRAPWRERVCHVQV